MNLVKWQNIKSNIVYTNENDFSNKISENKFKKSLHNIKKKKIE